MTDYDLKDFQALKRRLSYLEDENRIMAEQLDIERRRNTKLEQLLTVGTMDNNEVVD